MNDPLNDNQNYRRGLAKVCLTLCLFIFIIVMFAIDDWEKPIEQEVPKTDFDDQDTINKNGNYWDIENDRIVNGEPVELEKEI